VAETDARTESGGLVRHLLSATPLARSHERRQRARPSQRIAFQEFRRQEYAEPALQLSAHQLRSFAAGEYEAVGKFSRVTAALAFNGAPFDLISHSALIPADEIRHAEYMLRMSSLCGGQEAALRIDSDVLRENWSPPLDLETLDGVMVTLPALSETLAFAMLSTARNLARDATVRQVYSAVVADEISHLRLGWYYLKWREPQWSRAERQRVANVAAEILVELEPQLAIGRDAPPGAKRAARALGVLDSTSLRRLIRDVIENEIVPGLDALGLGGSHAWRLRRRASGI
jgi:hypothetical protein